MHSGAALRKLMQGNAPGARIRRYTGQFSNTPHIGLSSPTVVDDWIQELYRMFGTNADEMAPHLDELFAWELKHAEKGIEALKRTAALAPRRDRLGALIDELGVLVDDVNKPLYKSIPLEGLSAAERTKFKELRLLALVEDQ